MTLVRAACMTIALSTLARVAAADTPGQPAPPPMPTPIDGLGPDLVDAFSGTNLLWYGGAVAATGVMAFSGADHAIRVGVERNIAAPAYGDAAVYTGYILPVVAAPAIYLTGLVLRDPKTAGAGSAAVQALVVTLVTTGVLKIATGRSYPLHGGDPNAPDRLDHPEYARDFRPFQPQTLWPLPSWPSGHTSATTSVVAALTAYYPDQWWIPSIGYPLALAIGFGLIDGDAHWASDVVAGALIGHAIGYSIGRAFRQRQSKAPAPTVDMVPLLAPTHGGAALRVAW